jgi:primosomal protein N' (replication factor Y)
MPPAKSILRVAIPSPLRRRFDYLPPHDVDPGDLIPGQRLRVPFGRNRSVGVLLEVVTETDIDPKRLKPAAELLDPQPALSADILELARWAAQYYHHPIGEVLATALPVLLRHGEPIRAQGVRRWRLSAAGRGLDAEALKRAPRQAAVHALLMAHPEGLGREQLAEQPGDWASALKAMTEKGWVETEEQPLLTMPTAERDTPPPLNPAQAAAVDAVAGALDGFQPFLLHGVTGSGKTEVYLQLIARVLGQGRQALVLVPEIGLTPQLVERFRRRLHVPLAILHSGLTDRERLNAWIAARDGDAPVVIGTRSAVFTPLARPGLFIVDEEHDLSFKQHEGFRYSARDLTLMRARSAGIPVLLASATPSLESLHNTRQGRYQLLELPERAGAARHPHMQLADMRGQFLEDGLSQTLLKRMGEHLERGHQVLLFLNRRGYAPTLLCHDCGWVGECERCDAHLTLHQGQRRLRCHHCGAERPLPETCPACGSVDLRAVGQGTERMEVALERHFPDVGIVRIDRDSTRRKGAMESKLERIHSGDARILIGTQMLAKGHDFPDVTLVGVVDTDQGLFSADFRAPERLAQLVLQVAGRAGRADKPGEVLIQTHHPDHPLLQQLVGQDYLAFADAALAERQDAGLPPFSSLALLRAEAPDRDAPGRFLEEAAALAREADLPGVELFGPVSAPMERRQGRYRAQLLLQAAARADLHRLLGPWTPRLEQLKSARKVRWSLDVDPLDMM